MNQMKEIIAEYTAADEEMRLSMFLSHRDLRPEFTEIDMAGMKLRKNEGPRRAKDVDGGSRPHGFTRNCWGWLKHCWAAR